MVKCPHCGNELKPKAIRCIKCQQLVEIPGAFGEVYLCFAFGKIENKDNNPNIRDKIKFGEDKWISELIQYFNLKDKITVKTKFHISYYKDGIDGLDEYLSTRVANRKLLSFISMVPLMNDCIQDQNKINTYQDSSNVQDLLGRLKYFGFKSGISEKYKGLLICIEEKSSIVGG